MQDLSYVWPHPRWTTDIGQISVRVHTYDNVYGLDPARCLLTTTDRGLRVDCDGLTWAGGEPCEGAASVVIEREPAGVAVVVTATHPDGVRCVGLTIHDLPSGSIGSVREGELEVPSTGRLVGYPNGWFDLSTPMLAVNHADGTATVARSVDTQVHARRFAVLPHPNSDGQTDIDLVVDAPATGDHRDWTAPTWHLSRDTDARIVARRHADEVRAALGPPAWADRPDVPDWMRQVSLVVTLHGQHFTGFIFADYAQMLDDLRLLCTQIDGRRILAYLPGWEGRYYRWYGRYRTDPRMGGDDGFRRLVDGAHELGVHVMPMFGANYAARDLPGFERWAAPGLLMNPSGALPAGSVDWDGSRHYDHGSAALVNPAFAPWREHLVGEVSTLHSRFGFDAAFLDISAAYLNDPRGDTSDGLRQLAADFRAACPPMMLAGEGWFDAIAGAIPLVQTGHRDTVPVLHDDSGLFGYSNRQFGHLCLGDPASQSTGVHEAGHNAIWRLPVREDVIPTLAVAGATIEKAPEQVSGIVDDAHEYARRFLS